MTNGETILLEAVRDELRDKLGLNGNQCEIEYDDQPPSIAVPLYVCVIPAGMEQGPKHNSSGGVYDFYHSVKVTVLQRSTNVPRDRSRNIFIDQLTGLNKWFDQIVKQIDWKYNLMCLANHYLEERYEGSGPFIEPLRMTSFDSRPRMVTTETYAAHHQGGPGTTGYTAMARSVTFGKCRRMEVIDQQFPGGPD